MSVAAADKGLFQQDIWVFPTIRDPNIDPKQYSSSYEDTHEKEPPIHVEIQTLSPFKGHLVPEDGLQSRLQSTQSVLPGIGSRPLDPTEGPW